MMKTNGPVKDFTKYVLASSPRYLRPLASSEVNDTALFLYRQLFTKLSGQFLVPSLYVSSFAVIFFRLLFPRLFETQYASNTNYQVLEFAVLILGGLTFGSFLANIGLAKIASICQEAVYSAIIGEEPNALEIEHRSRKTFGLAYKTLFRAVWYISSFFLISVGPLVLSGLLIEVTSDKNVFPALIAIYAFISMPISLLLICARMGTGMSIVCVSLAENLTYTAAKERAKLLFKSKTQSASSVNPAVNGAVVTLLAYGFLKLGLAALEDVLGIRDKLLEIIPLPILKAAADIFVSMIPEFIVVWLAVPYISMAATFHYYQRRIVLEGLDIETLYEKLPQSRR